MNLGVSFLWAIKLTGREAQEQIANEERQGTTLMLFNGNLRLLVWRPLGGGVQRQQQA